MKKTILAGAVVLAFSTLATAQDIEGVQTETIADNTPIANTTLNLKDNAEFTVTGVTNQFGLLKIVSGKVRTPGSAAFSAGRAFFLSLKRLRPAQGGAKRCRSESQGFGLSLNSFTQE